jgi:hypothetical protein
MMCYTTGVKATMIKQSPYIACLLPAVLLFSLRVPQQEADPCAEFNALVAKTYTFKSLRDPGLDPVQIEKRAEQFWNSVKSHKQQYLPCLRKAVEDPKSNPIFRYDGSNLLVELDPSPASKSLQATVFMASDKDIMGASRWVTILSYRGYDGIDISKAAESWISDSNNHYTFAEDDNFRVGPYEGALFLYGSMDERMAVPSLIKVLKTPENEGREAAMAILATLGTQQAFDALKAVNPKEFSPDAQANLKTFLQRKPPLALLKKPHLRRNDYLGVLQAVMKGDFGRYEAAVELREHGEEALLSVMTPADLPLLRKARRLMITGCSQDAMERYHSLTRVILSIEWQPHPVQKK